MVYDPEDPENYLICKSADEIPEGWVDSVTKCKGGSHYADEEGLHAVTGEGTSSHERQHEQGGRDDKNGARKSTRRRKPAQKSRQRQKANELPDAEVLKTFKKSPAKGTGKPVISLKDMDISREEAEAILAEEGIEFSEKDSDEDITLKIEPLFE